MNPARRIPNFNDIADSLRTYLDIETVGYEHVALVGHSQGGLVIQRYLARMINAGKGRELARICKVILFACPNAGSEFGLSLRKATLAWRNPQERELRPINELITETQRVVLNQVVSARETTPTSCPIPMLAYAGETDNIVRPTSAKFLFQDTRTIPGDHFSIIRPDSLTHRSYTTFKHDLLATLDTIDAGKGQVTDTEPPAPTRSPRPNTLNRGANVNTVSARSPARKKPEAVLAPDLLAAQVGIGEVLARKGREEFTRGLNEAGEFASLLPWHVLEEIARADFEVAMWISQKRSGWAHTAAELAPEGASLPDWWTVTARFFGRLADPIGYDHFSFRPTDSYVRGISAGLRTAWEAARAADPDRMSQTEEHYPTRELAIASPPPSASSTAPIAAAVQLVNGYVPAGTKVDGPAALERVLSHWISTSDRPTIGDIGAYGGSPALIVTIGTDEFALNRDTKRAAVRAFLDAAQSAGGNKLSWHVTTNSNGKINRVSYRPDDEPTPGWYAYLRKPLSEPRTLAG